MLVYAKELVSISREEVIAVSFTDITAWLVGDKWGWGWQFRCWMNHFETGVMEGTHLSLT